MNGIQTQVGAQQVPAIAGDWASGNPRFFVNAGQGGLISGPSGLVVARAAWLSASVLDNDYAPAVANNFGTGQIAGILHRQQQGLIINFLADASMSVPGGFPVALCSGGDLWVKNDGATVAQINQKAYANFADGKFTFAATASPTSGATSTASTIAAKTATLTASIANNLLTVTAASGDPLVPGAVVGTATGVVTGTAIISQILPLLAGEAAGGIGRYLLTIGEQTIASESMTFTYGLLTVGGTVAGTFGVGNLLAATGSVVAGTYINGLGTGTGGAGTYYVNNNTAVSSQAINVAAVNVETKWFAVSNALPGELVKISSHLLG